ncbi:E3 Ubiquitin-Protein Ligase Herc2 [Manis pentadactyla]|nr:E3 Ubiquitin-Protein Ligase Herc2 [Manis pentadactyla]
MNSERQAVAGCHSPRLPCPTSARGGWAVTSPSSHGLGALGLHLRVFAAQRSGFGVISRETVSSEWPDSKYFRRTWGTPRACVCGDVTVLSQPATCGPGAMPLESGRVCGAASTRALPGQATS